MAAELALGIAGLVGTIDVCIKTGKSMVQACKDYRQSDARVNELIVRVEICWSRIVGQLEISKELWAGMSDGQKELQSRVLLVLQSKLVSATQLISKTDKHATLPKIRALHILTLRESLETTVSDLEAWQQRFEPSWFQIIKTSTFNVEALLRNRGREEPAREGLRFRRAFDNTHSVLISEESFQSLEKQVISYCKAQLATDSGDDRLHIIDTVSQDTVKLRDARELASRLRDSNPLTFGIMKSFVFRVPEGYSMVESCRKRLLSRSIPDSLTERLKIARQLVTAVYYVHLYDFVHKNITPETILILQRTGTEQDAMVVCLVGFQLMRNANALTNTSKEDRKNSVYQHPSRIGTAAVTFVMQHDIYSLGVCLLEIGLWKSFVDYGDNDTTEISEFFRTTEDTLTDLEPEIIKRRLISLSQDEGNTEFGDPRNFEDQDGVEVGSRLVGSSFGNFSLSVMSSSPSTPISHISIEESLPDIVRDYKLVTRREGIFTVHLHDDPEAPPMSPPRRERWEIVKTLGRGGQGEVVLERCVGGLRNLTERAVKKIPIERGDPRQIYKRELATIIKFSHDKYSRYFVKSLGWYPTRDHLYLAMEYHSSGDLYNYIKSRGPLPETDSRHVVTQVLSGIAMMHTEGFAHRDVKPKNILIHRHPQGNPPGSWWVKLADFGISKRSNPNTNNTTIIMGTRLFMAPELLRPDPPSRLDRNYQPGDIWALGITAFYILTKKLPFRDEGTVLEYARSSGQPFPSDCLSRYQVTGTGQDFIREVMDPHSDTRLDSDAAMQHAWTQPLLPDVSISGDQSRPSSSSSIDDFLGVPRPLMTITSNWTPQPALDEPTREYTYHDASSDVQSVERLSSGGPTTQESTREHRQSIYSQSLKNERSMTLKILTFQELSSVLRSGNVQAVKVRLQRNPNIAMESEWTPLLLSAAYGNVELAKFLIANGADTFVTRDRGNTPLHVCASVGHQAVGRLLIENGANIEARTGTGYTPLQVAAHKGHEPVVRLLLESGAKIEEKDEYGRTSLILATGKGHQGVVRLLLERDANIEVESSGGDTPLIQAVKEGHLAVVRVLIEKGADVETTDKDDKTPLIIASQRKQKGMVKLLEQNASPLIFFGSMTSSTDNRDISATLQLLLNGAGVHNIIESDGAWPENTKQYQKRIKPNPACIAFPKDKGQLAKCLKYARDASVKVTALGPGHSFQGLGFGFPGNLVINMKAFDSVNYDQNQKLLTFGGGSRVGPVAKYLWDTAGRHFPHVRASNVGLTGSSIGCGFGTTSRLLGCPMDNIVSIEVMLYDGTILVATEGSDLLWAAKGAAASYGIVISMTTKTFKPRFARAIKFIISLGEVDVDNAARAFISIQNFGTSSACTDEFAFRWSLKNWTTKGYFYGDPSTFDEVLKPLIDDLRVISPKTAVEKEELGFWDMEIEISGMGMDRPDGGNLNPLAFYLQSLVTTTDHPLTVDQARILFSNTTSKFHREDMTKMGYIDLWAGVSRDIADEDTGYPHGKNLWLIRWDADSVDSDHFPADGVAYMKGLMLPFEQALIDAGVPLRGFVNYADTELPQDELASRLYGENYDRLKRIKAEVDPEGLFTNNPQAISTTVKANVIKDQEQAD
ncbi:hypothetical protein FGRMN_125 [Fusarium graminum]|nr:hypothetical protein FGRMN_125 [Fusarium graminum]